MKKAMFIVLGIMIIAIGFACQQGSQFDKALAKATEEGKPFLVDFYAEWCGPCQRFTKASHEDAEVMAALENVVLHKVDCEKGEGIDLAVEFEIQGYPTYVLVNADKQIIARWSGFAKDYFINTLTEELADLATIDQKMARYDDLPTLNDAKALARYSSATGMYKDAVTYYGKAAELDDENNYAYDLLENTIRGIRGNEFTYEDAVKTAEIVFAGNDYTSQVYAASDMSRLAEYHEKMVDFKNYLELGMKAYTKANDENLSRHNTEFEIAYNLNFTGEKNKAVELKRSTYEDGWTEDANALNSFAWWCYENMINLEEAEKLAVKGVNLAQPGRSKAMILDTAAHICKALGNNDDAIKYMEMAVNEDPDDAGWQETLEEFKTDM